MFVRPNLRALWFRGITAAALAIVCSLALSGCGGGGSNGGGGGGGGGCTGRVTPPGSPTLATVTGMVFDTGGSPINNVPVTIIVPGGTNISVTTDCTGKFVATNVPLTARSMTVVSPDPVSYYNYANYNGHLYDLVACTMPLPSLSAGNNTPYSVVVMYLGGLNPPPPPPSGGCPS